MKGCKVLLWHKHVGALVLSSAADLLDHDPLEDQRRLEVIATEAKPHLPGTQLISPQCLRLATIETGYVIAQSYIGIL